MATNISELDGTLDNSEKYQVKDKPSTDNESYFEYPDDGIETQFTWRSAIVGSLLGCVIASSNMYLGLKIGWTFGAGLFGAILGYAILKAMERLPLKFGGGPFGMKENCSVQTAATASGGLSAGFVAGVPAMFRLGLMPPLNECWGMFFLWTLAAGFYGLFFAIPLRSYFVIQQKLVFPSCSAAANTIRTLHSDSSLESKTQTKFIIWSFSLATLFKFVSYFVPFIVNLHPLYWISKLTGSTALSTIDLVWGWKIQVTTAFLGAGMMVGLNTAISFFSGNVLAWGILGPLLMYNPSTDILHDSPRGVSLLGVRVQYWNLWVGISIMICASFTELLMQYPSLINAAKGAGVSIYNLIARLFRLSPIVYEGDKNKDPVSPSELVPTWVWSTGLLSASFLTILVLCVFFNMSLGASILAGILGFLFSFIGCQSSGETDINPTGVIGKASQFVFAGIPAPTLKMHQTNNLVAGILSASCASQAVDMVGDLKTGHLLKASPRSQFYAQTIGASFGIVVAVLLFMLFATAYPCILVDPIKGAPECAFQAPAVQAWAGVTRALTTDVSKSIPFSCRIAILIFSLLTITTIILKNTLLLPYAAYIPNWNAIGIAFVSFDPTIPLANLTGAIVAIMWAKRNPKQWELVGIALASGLIAGEGIGGVLQAVLNIIGLNQEYVATGFLCPNFNPTSC